MKKQYVFSKLIVHGMIEEITQGWGLGGTSDSFTFLGHTFTWGPPDDTSPSS